MRPLSFSAKRVIAGIYLVPLVVCAVNHWANLNLVSGYDKKALALVTFIGVLFTHRWAPGMIEEMHARRGRKRV